MVIDTMIFAYAFLKASGEYEESLRVLEQSKSIWVPDIFRAEFANVLWQYVTHKKLSRDLAGEILLDAENLTSEFISSSLLWERALELAVSFNHPVYDTLLIALAELKRSKLITYDKKLLRKFPKFSLHPKEFLN